MSIRDWVKGVVHEVLTSTPKPAPCGTFINVDRITNGYLLRMESVSIGQEATTTFCATPKELAETLIAEMTKQKMGIKVMASTNYPQSSSLANVGTAGAYTGSGVVISNSTGSKSITF